MTTPSLLIVGCGDLGTHLGLQMARLNWQVYGARRNTRELPVAITPIIIDLFQPTMPHEWPNRTIDYVVFCVAPNKSDKTTYQQLYCQGLTYLINWLKQSNQTPKQLMIISSTAVYGQKDGQWVDESSPTEPTSSQGKTMLVMEQLAQQSGFNSCIVRLAGIYGPRRYYLINQAKTGVHYPSEPPLYANRIHIEDAASLLKQLLLQHQAGLTLESYYIGVDDTPAAIQETLTWLRKKLGVQQLATEYSERATGSKRLSNYKARATGWQPFYPSYKEGYLTLLS